MVACFVSTMETNKSKVWSSKLDKILHLNPNQNNYRITHKELVLMVSSGLAQGAISQDNIVSSYCGEGGGLMVLIAKKINCMKQWKLDKSTCLGQNTLHYMHKIWSLIYRCLTLPNDFT